jgi:hypothetical protein
MSKIKAELVEATELSTKRGESVQEFLARLVKAVAELSDKEWEKLSQEAQNWFNDAADAKNAKAQNLPDFPDNEEVKEEKTTGRRSTKTEESAKPKVGVVAKVTTKRGKTATGKIVELDDKIIVLKMGDGSEEEFARDRVETIEVAGGEAQDDGPTDPVIEKGVEVKVVTKRGKEVTGVILEIDDKVLVLDIGDGKEEEFDPERLASVTPVGKPKTSGRRSAKEDEPTGGRRGSESGPKDEKPAEEGRKRSSNASGVSVGTRIKEIIADDFDVTEDEIAKILKKEGIEFRENTLSLNFKDCQKFIEVLKKAKKLK